MPKKKNKKKKNGGKNRSQVTKVAQNIVAD